MPQRVRSTGNGPHGMNWITQKKRLAIYMRDGLGCCYCGAGIEDGIRLTLDHLIPRSEGGTNDAQNLVTACHRCNSVRGTRDWRVFTVSVAEYINNNVRPESIMADIYATIDRPLDLAAAKAMIAARGSVAAALRESAQQ